MKKVRKDNVVFGCAITKELKSQLADAAKRQGRTLSSLARLFLAEGVRHLPKA
jgi:hypothetical protein